MLETGLIWFMFESLVNYKRSKTEKAGMTNSPGLRALLIIRGLKHCICNTLYHLCLRALLIIRGLKHCICNTVYHLCLRALLIIRGLKQEGEISFDYDCLRALLIIRGLKL